MLHLAEHVDQEKHLAIAGAGNERKFWIVAVLDYKTRDLSDPSSRPSVRDRPSSSCRMEDWQA